MTQKRLFILGVPLDVLSESELKQQLISILLYRRQRQIVTPNPEFLLLAQRHQEFLSVLREAHLSIPDGFGLKIAAWIKRSNLQRFPGSNVVKGLLKFASRKGLKIAIINRRDGLSSNEKILETLMHLYPDLQVYIEAVEKKQPHVALEQLKNFQPDILFSTLGAPEQDILISRIRRKLPSLRLGMGVGGSFDYLTKKLPRAPRIFRQLGFEWLWRLFLQPRRWKRIWNAIPVFITTVIQWEFRSLRFRPNVVIMIINKEEEVLILNARGHGNYWGVPQGGQDPGESVEETMRREAFEETGLRDLHLLVCFRNIYQYTWNKPYTHSGYKGQRQTLCVVRYEGEKNAVKTNPLEHKAYRWVKMENLISQTSPVHKKQYELFLKKYRDYIKNT